VIRSCSSTEAMADASHRREGVAVVQVVVGPGRWGGGGAGGLGWCTYAPSIHSSSTCTRG
jgi:hypothetical protein